MPGVPYHHALPGQPMLRIKRAATVDKRHHHAPVMAVKSSPGHSHRPLASSRVNPGQTAGMIRSRAGLPGHGDRQPVRLGRLAPGCAHLLLQVRSHRRKVGAQAAISPVHALPGDGAAAINPAQLAPGDPLGSAVGRQRQGLCLDAEREDNPIPGRRRIAAGEIQLKGITGRRDIDHIKPPLPG
ncbi:MAG: hypothetical protein FP810_18485 [Desulfocapsa sp.]|nr:hypothetical protein [Desulfocapsa sp.]MBU4108141.1 hypothetical protein [Pseudomonadota bacterium]MCG2744278.1 hypothetical protein [Desulfobacteraceae bacterium]